MSSPKIMLKSESLTNPLAHRLDYTLKRAQHALRISMDEQLGPLGLTAPQYNAFSVVQLQPGISNAALAHTAFVSNAVLEKAHALLTGVEAAMTSSFKENEAD